MKDTIDNIIIDIVTRNQSVTYNNKFISFLVMASIILSLFVLSGRVVISQVCGGCIVVIVGILLCVLCVSVYVLIITPALYYFEMAIINTHHQFFRILEVLSKVFCHFSLPPILFIATMLITSCILSRRPVRVARNHFITLLIILLSTALIMSTGPLLPNYCCQFIPVCV